MTAGSGRAKEAAGTNWCLGAASWWGAGWDRPLPLPLFLGKVHQENLASEDEEEDGPSLVGDDDVFASCICLRVVRVGWLICSSWGMVGRFNSWLISSRRSLSLEALGLSWSRGATLEMFSNRMVCRQLRWRPKSERSIMW